MNQRTRPLAANAVAAFIALFGAMAPARGEGIFDAVRSNNLARFSAIIEQEGPQAAKAKLGNEVTPLHLAAALNRVDMVRRLLAAGAAVDARTSGGFTPLHWAASRDAAESAKLLLDAGADVEARTPDGITPLHWAASKNAVSVVRLLLAAGARSDAATDKGQTPLHWALMNGSEDAAELIAYQRVSEDVDRKQAVEEVDQSGRDEEMTELIRESKTNLAREAMTREAAVETPKEELPVEVMPKPVPGKALKVPIGFRQYLEFVWIEPLKMWMGKYEITNGQYRRYDSRHTSLFREGFTLDADDQPVVLVSWEDAQAFAAWLNKKFAGNLPPGWKFRLPTEDEWEYTARCGDRRIYPWGNAWPPAYGNFSDLTARRDLTDWSGIRGYDDGYPVSCPVTASGVNEWGIYGMAGNVWEWCQDWYDSSKKYKVRRGGGWDFDPQENLRVDARGFDRPAAKYDTIGFRLVVSDRD